MSYLSLVRVSFSFSPLPPPSPSLLLAVLPHSLPHHSLLSHSYWICFENNFSLPRCGTRVVTHLVSVSSSLSLLLPLYHSPMSLFLLCSHFCQLSFAFLALLQIRSKLYTHSQAHTNTLSLSHTHTRTHAITNAHSNTHTPIQERVEWAGSVTQPCHCCVALLIYSESCHARGIRGKRRRKRAKVATFLRKQ